MKNRELILLVGNIGNGKTTLCKKFGERGYLIVSQDDFRYSIGAGKYTFDINYEPCIKETAKALARSFMKRDISLVIDETNMSKRIRKKYLSLAKIYEYKTRAIILPKLSQKKSVQRRLKNNHGNTPKIVWENVWEMFDIMYEIPTKAEGFNQVIQL